MTRASCAVGHDAPMSSRSTAAVSRRFRVETSWGVAVISTVGDDVVALSPPDASSSGSEAGTEGAVEATSIDVPRPARQLATALVEYFAGERAGGLASRQDVARWLAAAGVSGARLAMSLALFDVPPGVTISYGELSAIAGYPGAARAAGSTCARNPLPVVIPCHRVLHAGARRGDVGSYGAASGPAFKRRLLELERAPHVVATSH